MVSSFIYTTGSKTHFCLKKSYVVYLGAHSHGPDFSPLDSERVTQSHYEFLGSFLGSHEVAKEALFYSYTRHINGFAAEIANHPRVISVFLNKEITHNSFMGFLGTRE